MGLDAGSFCFGALSCHTAGVVVVIPPRLCVVSADTCTDVVILCKHIKKMSLQGNYQLLSAYAFCMCTDLAFCIPSFSPRCWDASLYSHRLGVCCCASISPSQCLLYLEAEHYQSLQLAACDFILTDLQRSQQSPLFLSRSFFRPPPFSPFLFTPSLLIPFFLSLSPSYLKPISVLFSSLCSLFALCLYTP